MRGSGYDKLPPKVLSSMEPVDEVGVFAFLDPT